MRTVATKEQMAFTGVYAIVHVASGKRYVGSAAQSFGKRWESHRIALNKGKHYNRHLQSAWIKYGEDAFEWRIEEVTRPEHAVCCEQVFIDYWQSSVPQFGYNIFPTAGSPRGVKHSEERKARNSAMATVRMNKPERRASQSLSAKSQFNTPIAVAAASARMTARMNTPEEKSANSARGKVQMRTPTMRAIQSERMKVLNADPSFREKVKVARLRSGKPTNSKRVLLTRGNEQMEFASGKLACDCLGLSRTAVANAIYKRCLVAGWSPSYV